MNNSKLQKPLDTVTFLRIRKWYILAFAGIALTIICAQILIQNHLNSQLNDSRVINVAGRQRAYSQKLVKEVLLLKETPNTDDEQHLISELKKTVSVWKASHQGLQSGDESLHLPEENDTEILALFQALEPHHSAMVTAVDRLIAFEAENNSITAEILNLLVENQNDILLVVSRPLSIKASSSLITGVIKDQ